MSRYIDANALIESIKNELWDWDSLDGITSAAVLKQTITDIQNAPTADVVEKERYDRVRENANILADALSEYQSADVAEVVRCKDCAYKQYYFTNDMVKCGCGNGSHHEDFFCADGERRDDDRNG